MDQVPNLKRVYRPAPAEIYVEYTVGTMSNTEFVCVAKLYSTIEAVLQKSNGMCSTRVVIASTADEAIDLAEIAMQSEIAFYGFCGGQNKSFAMQPVYVGYSREENRVPFILTGGLHPLNALGAPCMRPVVKKQNKG